MPGRKIPLITNEIYHVFNKGVADSPIFKEKGDYQRAIKTFLYYQSKNVSVRYSQFLNLPSDQKRILLEKAKKKKDFLVEIIAYCLLPNHFHFIIRQKEEKGTSKFFSNFQNSYSRYFNTKYNRVGALFQGRFKAIRVETDQQLIHLSRYIHLNPHASYIVRSLKDLENYPYSSFFEYIEKGPLNICLKEVILNQFKTRNAYKEFVFDYANYQRELEKIKHLIMEEK